MMERAGYRWGLIALVAAVAVIAGAGSGAWRYGALIIGVPVIGAFHLAWVLAERLQRRRTGGSGEAAAADPDGGEDGAA